MTNLWRDEPNRGPSSCGVHGVPPPPSTSGTFCLIKIRSDLDIGVLMNNVTPARYFHELDEALVQDMAACEGARAAAPTREKERGGAGGARALLAIVCGGAHVAACGELTWSRRLREADTGAGADRGAGAGAEEGRHCPRNPSRSREGAAKGNERGRLSSQREGVTGET